MNVVTAGKRIKQSIPAVAAALMLAGCSFNTAQPPSNAEALRQADPDNGKASDRSAKDTADGVVVSERIYLDPAWEWADLSAIDTGFSVLYKASHDRKDVIVAVNAGHGTKGGEDKSVYCHPDGSPKITDGTNPAGSLTAVAISLGMIFNDGTYESDAALQTARILRDELLDDGYDVLMIRDSRNINLDNVARTVIANNMAACLISLHFDDDGLTYDKGCFFVPTPDEIKEMDPVKAVWQEHDRLGNALIDGLRDSGCTIYEGFIYPQELTQTCYSRIPAVVMELGNATTKHDDASLLRYARGLCDGVEKYLDRL